MDEGYVYHSMPLIVDRQSPCCCAQELSCINELRLTIERSSGAQMLCQSAFSFIKNDLSSYDAFLP